MRKTPMLLLAAGLGLALSAPATAQQPDRHAEAWIAAGWLAQQVNDQGFVPSGFDPSAPDYATTAQAVIAFEAAAFGGPAAATMLDYLSAHVDAFVVRDGADAPGSLAYLILAAVAGGREPTAFGGSDLVTRLRATEQDDGRYGAQDPSFDGAFRQGLALLALAAVGETDDAAVAWLVDQQCDGGLWTAFRADTAEPCPAVDAATFSGPDTNSTALAVLALDAHGESAAATAGVGALAAVRGAGGGWGYLAAGDQAADANSTALVAQAILAVNGTPDTSAEAFLVAMQVPVDPCAPNEDQGGVAFQPETDGSLVPNALATVQVVPALARRALPVAADGVNSLVIDFVCSPTTTTTTPETATTTTAVVGRPLPRTGDGSGALALVGTGMAAVGAALVLASRRWAV